MPPRQEQPPELMTVDMICQFNKLKPPKFEGRLDLLVSEALLRKMENLLPIMECLDRFKVHLATYQFPREVQFQWGTIKPQSGDLRLTWN